MVPREISGILLCCSCRIAKESPTNPWDSFESVATDIQQQYTRPEWSEIKFRLNFFKAARCGGRGECAITEYSGCTWKLMEVKCSCVRAFSCWQLP